MPKFAANLSFLFTESSFLDRFKLAATAGFTGVEYLFPYEYQASVLSELLQANQLEQVLFNLPPGDWQKGERGLASLPGRQGEFREGVEQALSYAEELCCSRLHCMAGLRHAEFSEDEQEARYVANLQWAADRLVEAGVTLLIEPINSRIDMPGYWLDSVTKAQRVLRSINRANVRLQLDLYHAQIIQGDLARCLTDNLAQLGHVQIADNPGRHEPGSGEINYPYLFRLLDQLGYPGWVGCEYKPAKETLAGLGWMKFEA